MTTQLAIIIGALASCYLMTVASADCDKLENIDNLMENCKIDDLDEKVCENLDITLEKDDDDKIHGGDYQYIGTVELNSGATYPFYKQMSPVRGIPPLYMYHTRVNNHLVATDILEEQKNLRYAFMSTTCKGIFDKNKDYYDFETCSGEAEVRVDDRNVKHENMELTIKCSDSSGLGAAGIIGIIVAIIVIIAIVILVILVVRKRRHHRETIGMHTTAQL